MLCEKAELKGNSKDALQGFNVILEDTILFPEGGGQVKNFSAHFSVNVV